MTGYRTPYSFAVELYRGDWIMRAVMPGDAPIEDAPQAAKCAMDYWRASNILQFNRGLQ